MRARPTFRFAVLAIFLAATVPIPPALHAQDTPPQPSSVVPVPQESQSAPPIVQTRNVCKVALRALIAKDGTMHELEYISGSPLLIKSALRTAEQLHYEPTLLDGKSVEVHTTLSAVFSPADCKPTSQNPSSVSTSSADSGATTLPKPVHILIPAALIKQVQPNYPRAARRAKVCGTVVLHGIITKEGTPAQVGYRSGPESLVKAATDAVQKWRYYPTHLDGNPIDVDTTISVVFQLDGCTPQQAGITP